MLEITRQQLLFKKKDSDAITTIIAGWRYFCTSFKGLQLKRSITEVHYCSYSKKSQKKPIFSSNYIIDPRSSGSNSEEPSEANNKIICYEKPTTFKINSEILNFYCESQQ